MPRDVEITNTKQLADFAKTIKRAGGAEVGKRLNAALRQAGQPAVADAKRSALSIPSKGRGSTGLRRAIARATSLRVSGGRLRVFVNPKRLPPNQQAMPRALEGPAPFRRPVFGNPNAWVSQQAHPYFNPVLDRHRPRVVAQVQRVIQEFLNEIGRKAH
jgi:hypothetical protein